MQGPREESHRLVGLPKAHVIAEEPRQAMAIEEPEPLNAQLLIGPQSRFQMG